jgi:hypothetical protein
MGNLLIKFCDNQTDLNNNGIPDRDELIKVIEQQLNSKKAKQNKKILKKISLLNNFFSLRYKKKASLISLLLCIKIIMLIYKWEFHILIAECLI